MTTPRSERLFVHLSDIHFDARSATLKGLNKAIRNLLLDDLRIGTQTLGVPDGVLVTGDIAFSGKAAEFAQASEFLAAVTEVLGIDPTLVLTVPGNHDVDRSQVSPELEAIHGHLRSLEPIEMDAQLTRLVESESELLVQPLGEYNRFAVAYNCQVGRKNPYWRTPWLLSDNWTLWMHGLTTVYVIDWDDEKSNLVVGTIQTSLAAEYGDTDIVVVLGHHPPEWWHDRSSAEVGLMRFASVELFGHEHEHHLTATADSVKLVAGAVHPERDPTWKPTYNWLRIGVGRDEDDVPALQVDVWPRVYGEENKFDSEASPGGWEPDRRGVALVRAGAPAVSAEVVADSDAGETSKQGFASPAAATGTTIATEITELTDGAIDPGLVERVPVVDEDNRPNPIRRAAYDFSMLKYGAQMRILGELELIDDGDWELRPDELFQRAFGRAAERGKLEQLARAVAAAAAG